MESPIFVSAGEPLGPTALHRMNGGYRGSCLSTLRGLLLVHSFTPRIVYPTEVLGFLGGYTFFVGNLSEFRVN